MGFGPLPCSAHVPWSKLLFYKLFMFNEVNCLILYTKLILKCVFSLINNNFFFKNFAGKTYLIASVCIRALYYNFLKYICLKKKVINIRCHYFEKILQVNGYCYQKVYTASNGCRYYDLFINVLSYVHYQWTVVYILFINSIWSILEYIHEDINFK